MGKRTDQHLQDMARYNAAPESVQVAAAKRQARIDQEKRLATPPPQPHTTADLEAHKRAIRKLRGMGFLTESTNSE